ncbi:SPDEF factor, partial [Ramphastos sulfuratus]|nr:SPDEF factor [Ramphastos sulfuratus]
SPSPPSTPEQPLPAFCLHYFDMLYSEDIPWATKGMGEPSPSGAQGGRGEAQKEPEQCPIIDSQGLGLGSEGDLALVEHSLEQVQSLVVGEVLKDIETACKLLNIAAGECPPAPPGQRGRDVPAWGLKPCCSFGGTTSAWVEAPEATGFELPVPSQGLLRVPGVAQSREVSLLSISPIPSTAGGDASWADSEVDSSCAGQPIHLWQFLKELLLKPHNYGRFIRWLNKEKGIFKIEDSAQVARLWGIRKNRPAMNYDKLSRSIRQYYKKGIIRKPDISQRLVYQFVHPV